MVIFVYRTRNICKCSVKKYNFQNCDGMEHNGEKSEDTKKSRKHIFHFNTVVTAQNSLDSSVIPKQRGAYVGMYRICLWNGFWYSSG